MAHGFNDDKSKYYFLSNVITKTYNNNIAANSHAKYSITDIEHGNYLMFIYINSNVSKKFRLSVSYTEINEISGSTKEIDYKPSYLDFYDQCACIPIVLNNASKITIDIYNANLEQNGYFQSTFTLIPF